MTNNKQINCPTCKKSDTWQKDNPCRPFCSARCKLIDLGEWAAEEHKISEKSMASDLLIDPDAGSED